MQRSVFAGGISNEQYRHNLEKRKLAMTPYNPKHAHAEFEFIYISFTPQGKSDQEDYEGGLPNDG